MARDGERGQGQGVQLQRGDGIVPIPLTAPMCPQESGKAKDFVGLGLKDGHLVFR